MSTYTLSRSVRRRRRGRHKKLKLVVAILCGIIIFFAVYFMRNVTAVFLSVSEASVLAMNTIAVNEAISTVLSEEEVDYDDLITIVRGDDGNVNSITANTAAINAFARKVNRLARENFAALSEEGVSVPLGALTGIEALAGFGPSITIKIIPVNSIDSRFVSQFSSAGINQTLHSLIIQVVAEISIILPSQTVKKTAVSEVLVAESIIRGTIPDVYLQGGWLSSGGGLIPDA